MTSYMFKFAAPISEGARSHVLQVYSLLTAGVVCASVGCYADMRWFHLGGLVTALIGAFLFAFARSQYCDQDLSVGMAAFLAAAAIEGMAISPLVHTASLYHPQALVSATLTTIAVFASFSFAALVARRRQFLFLSGIIGTIASYLAIASLGNMLFRSPFIMDIQIYGGLAMFLGYVLLDTQVMIERFETGVNRKNIVRPACDLFSDLVAVFVRILIILMRQSEQKKRYTPQSTSSPDRKYYQRRRD